ncbi:NAD-dependent epimerase/dehydratase [Streptomyces venezuelae]|uniref:NAD-dependent epimerase/dehydratase family protein n=1 Tax=Streptomyces venezuelae TaxID=54571 RepID=UPI00123DEA71|nr:NAD-dependent epimerase/dehydratase family protein [Streptomyces venezuelae]QES12228.1 NAD-dependent epimerase/dehydratase [Streptomyces venezuelae]
MTATTGQTGDTRPLVVVLGAAGFVGSAVLRELARHDLRVRAVSRRPVTVPAGARAEVETRSVDLTAPGAMAGAIEGADVVVHSIAYIAGSSTWRITDGDTGAERVNVGLVRDLVEAVRASGRPDTAVLFTGSVSAAGPSERGVYDGTEPDEPQGEYDRQKLAAERVLLAASAEGVLRGISLRLPTVFGYGPDSTARDKGIVSSMVRRAVAGEPITMWHDGTVRRDLLYVEDVARAFAAALGHLDALAGRHWVLGSGHGAELGPVFTTVARMVAERTGKPPVAVRSVEPPAHAEARDFASVTVDPRAFHEVTGWRAEVPLDEALDRTTAFSASGAEEHFG